MSCEFTSSNKNIKGCFRLFFSFLILYVFGISTVHSLTPPTAERVIFDEPVVNFHPGYIVAADISGEIDKVMLFVAGFDTVNTSHPEDSLDAISSSMQSEIDALSADGWDIMFFEYVDGGIDLKDNADNLARFIEHIDSLAEPDYHLAVAGASMGGIVTRTMFVQEYSDMGVDTYLSLDSPHKGVTFSNWVDTTVGGTVAFLMLQHPAGLQMFNNHPAYLLHYGWLENIEHNGHFMENIIDPMATCALALSDGEASWFVKNSELWTHNKWWPISSTLEVEGLTSTFMPYHSVVNMDNSSTHARYRFIGMEYEYKNTHTSYFDEKIPNPQAVHAGSGFALLFEQAIDFIVVNGPTN